MNFFFNGYYETKLINILLSAVVEGTNPNWSTIGGKLTQLDVSPANVVWGVNQHHHIYILNGNGWQRVPGGLTHVTVGSAGVWGVNSGGNIYYREGVTLSSPMGTTWTHIPGNQFVYQHAM